MSVNTAIEQLLEVEEMEGQSGKTHKLPEIFGLRFSLYFLKSFEKAIETKCFFTGGR